jgi:PAS domain S-box-containing protein
MSWQTIAVPSIYLATAIVGAVAAYFAWRRRITPGASALGLLMVAASLWALADGLESAAPDLDTKILFAKASYVGIQAVPLLFFLFVLLYTGRRHWVTRPRQLLAWLMPVVTMLMVFTNERHSLIWTSVQLVDHATGVKAIYTHGPWFWMATAYNYSFLIAGTLLLALSALHYRGLYRRQAAYLLIATTVPLLANLVYLTGLSPLPGLDLTSVAFVVSGTLVAWAIFRLALFELGPIARNTLFDKMSDALLVLDPRNRVVDANPVAYAMFKPADQLIGRPLAQVFEDADAENALLQDGREVRSVVTLANGQPRYLDALCTPLLDHSGQQYGRLIVLRDITERVKMEEELRRSEHHYRSFLATVSHELRTPLTGIMGLAEALQAGVYGPVNERQEHSLALIEESGRHLARVISDILDLSKIQAGKVDLNLEPCAVLDLCRSSVNMVKHLAEARRQRILCDPRPRSFVVEVDIRRMQQVLVNLLSNAIKFSPEEADIGVEIRLLEGEQTAAMTVWDHGIGIAPEDQARLFQPFVQLDNGLARQYGGTGLGLTLARSLVELHGGTLTLESEVGVGSRFTVTLPLQPVRLDNGHEPFPAHVADDRHEVI